MQKKSKGSNIMSLSMDEELQALLTKTAKENNISRSELVRNLVTKFIVSGKKTTVVEHDADHIPVVLKIPVTLKGKGEELKTWLDTKVNALVAKLGS
jgi:hypothetical protein